MYQQKNRPREFNVYYRRDELGRLPRLNAYRSYGAKPLNGSPARLNNPSKDVENKTGVCTCHLL